MSLFHTTIPAGVNQPGFTGVTPSIWAQAHTFLNGTQGATLVYNTGNSDNLGYVATAAGFLLASGTNVLPSYTATVPFNAVFQGSIQFSTSASFATAGTILKHAADGLLIAGVTGSVYDFTITTPSGTPVLSLLTGTSNIQILGAAQFPNSVSFLTNGAIFRHANDGLTISGVAGSQFDFALTNPSGTNGIIIVPTGTLNVTFGGGIAGIATPTIASGGGTGASITGSHLGFRVVVGTTPGSTNIVINLNHTFATAPFVGIAYSPAATVQNVTIFGSTSTTQVTLTPYVNWVAGDVINVVVHGV